MLNFANFFLQGLKNTLRLQNGVNFSHKGPWILFTENAVLDEFYVGDFMAAEYTIVIDAGNTRKEMIKALVVAGPESATVTVYGRTNLNENLIDLNVLVTASKCTVTIRGASSPNDSTYDNSTLLSGAKIIYGATYFYTINELVQY